MQIDVAQLRDFYATPLGRVVTRLINVRIRTRWRNVAGCNVVGLGFAPPYLNTLRGEADRVGAFMPSGQGALVWPSQGPKACALVDEEQLPLVDNSVDYLLVVHGFEMAARPQQVLREIWRVLAPQGRVLMVVPNRSGVWARTDRTPFGFGRPYSRSQLETMLNDSMFGPVHWGSALYCPPFSRDTLLKTALAWERVGSYTMRAFGGVILVEATKELVAPVGKAQRRRVVSDLVPVPSRQFPRQTNRRSDDRNSK